MKTATFGAGCFWGVEHTFRKMQGVESTQVGFMGGQTENPTYKEVCYSNTGHVEVVEVNYDPARVSYNELLEVFWSNHNPTQVNRQGPDVGEQYRSVIFVHDDEQKEVALRSKSDLNKSGRYPSPIATHIEDASQFYRAEEYHQNYFEKMGVK